MVYITSNWCIACDSNKLIRFELKNSKLNFYFWDWWKVREKKSEKNAIRYEN